MSCGDESTGSTQKVSGGNENPKPEPFITLSSAGHNTKEVTKPHWGAGRP